MARTVGVVFGLSILFINTIYTCGMQTKCCSFFILCSFKFREKKLTPALFVNDFCSPKVTTPLKLRPPKAGNSESNEGRYYRNSTVRRPAAVMVVANRLTSKRIPNFLRVRVIFVCYAAATKA